MGKLSEKQKQIQFYDSMQPYSKFYNMFLKNDKLLWDIDTPMGQINVLSRLSPSTIDRFDMKSKVENVLSKKPNKCGTKGFTFFKTIHNLESKQACYTWPSISKTDRELYEQMVPYKDTVKKFFKLHDLAVDV